MSNKPFKVRLNFQDFLAMLEECEYGYHFESLPTDDNTLHLRLFVDGNPSACELFIRYNYVEVTGEMEL